ncbi:MAG: FAD-dependent thymidylate synthase [Thermoanaerobaculia bacterium]
MSTSVPLPDTAEEWKAPSAAPEVRMVNLFDRAYDGVVAAARTCYSTRIITPEQVGGDAVVDHEDRQARQERRDRLAEEIYRAGHHTTYQHAHVQFALTNVSRQFLWSFLHAHPFYNSEQVSQRYVEVRDGNYLVPPLQGKALEIYLRTVRMQSDAYHRLIEVLHPTAEREYLKLFPGRKKNPERVAKDVKKRAQEIARYVLPVATFAYLYHTVSVLTLFRYYRLANELDAPAEQRFVIGKMVSELLAREPDYRKILEEPIPLEETLEYQTFASLRSSLSPGANRVFREEFDQSLEGRVSKLIDWKANAVSTLASSVREVLGIPREALSDCDAVRLVLDPARNRYLSESLVLTTIGKLTRSMHNVHYTFRKKLSHTADSQDQRHRMTPASRPVVHAYLSEEPDYVVPMLIGENAEGGEIYASTMKETWNAIGRLRELGVDATDVAYLLPNAVSIRFTESSDLLNLHHKHKMRLCYNAQEEIWRASLDEAIQIRELHPEIGSYLLPPCTPRKEAKVRPYCPEGPRYCGVPVWNLDLEEYERIL